MANFLTYGQCFDYTCQYRDTWTDDHPGEGSKTARINATHLIKYKSRGLKIKDINQGLIDEMKHQYCYGTLDHTNTTVRKIIKAIQTVLNHCIEAGKVPMQDPNLAWINYKGQFSFKAPKNNKVDRVIMTEAQVKHFVECARSLGKDVLADTILLSCYTSMGWDEFSQLQVQDVELGVPIPKIYIGRRKDFTVKTDARIRHIPLPPGTDQAKLLIPILHKQIEACEHQPNMLLFGDYWTNDEQHRDQFKAVRDYAGLDPRILPYNCRHTNISWLAKWDVHPKKAKQLAGHKLTDTTMNYYTHVTDDDLVDAVSRLKAG